MKLYAEVEVGFHAFLNSAPDRDEWSPSCRPVSTEQEGWSAPQPLYTIQWTERSLVPTRNQNKISWFSSPYNDYAILALYLDSYAELWENENSYVQCD
jgi:hypothetical protein